MLKKSLIIFGLAVVALLLAGIINLLVLRHSISTYASYWKQQASQPVQSGEFTYLVLGDSIAQAIGASSPQNGYVGLVAKHIHETTGKNVRVINLSVTGARLSDLLKTQLPELPKYKPDLITVEIGANDMRSYDRVTFRSQYEQFIKAMPPDISVISNMPYFGTRKSVNPNALDANRTIAELALKYQIPLVDIYGPLKDHQSPLIYGADFFHPSDRGYRIWYNAFLPAIRL